MKESQLKQFRSKLNKTVEEIPESTPEEEMTHQLIEALSDKIDDMNLFISQTQALLSQSSLQNKSDVRSCSTESSTSNDNSNTSTSSDASSNQTASSCDCSTNTTSTNTTSASTNSANTTSSNDTDERIGIVGSGIGGTAGSKKISPDTFLLGSSNYEYYSPDKTNYLYGFTNSEFFAFIGALDPIEYILVITVISILIATQLNTNEQQLVGGALIDIGVTIGNIVEQTLFQQARQNEINTKKRQAAFQTDISNIYNSLVTLQEEINALRDELNLD
ncbi:hypothetical protein [Turicibacter sanguinis]|uniref:hypothetical protein n=1 Tax=Turicibacter sanguinis TaxID=154288 RepID=UPI0018AA9B20|nr:hypothetical protein [Turicibacter sanguinis]MDB8553145.1 hypothetical protein [Turicibacter sanguinis]